MSAIPEKTHKQTCNELKSKWLDCCQKYGPYNFRGGLCEEKYRAYQKQCVKGDGLRKKLYCAIFSTH